MKQKIIAAVSFALTAFALGAFAGEPEKTYIVANSADPDSVALAESYAKQRGVPNGNIIALDLPKKMHISAGEYFEQFENPLMEKLSAAGALKAEKTGKKIFGGRDEMKFLSHDIDYIILMRGVPVGILPSEGKGGLKTDAASVDSELSARFAPAQTRDGFIKNPIYGAFKEADQFKRLGILRVFRLDGPARSDVEKIIQSGLRAEKSGLRGRAYIDKSLFAKPGDEMLDKSAEILDKLNFDLSIDSEKPLFDFDKRMDAAAFYFGWYANNPQKYFADKNFKLADGAVCVHIFSFSAHNMADARQWTPRFAQLGALFAAGNVFEPYLALTHNTAALSLAIARGMSLGEAAYAAQPALSWQTVNVGDPLARPMSRNLSEQLKDIAQGRVDELSQYSVIRAMNAAEKQKGTNAAISLGKAFLEKLDAKYALLWRLSQAYAKAGQAQTAVQTAEEAAKSGLCKRPDLQGLAMEIAEFLAANSAGESAMKIYDNLAEARGDMPFCEVLVKRAKEASEKCGVQMSERLRGIEERVAKHNADLAERKRLAEEKNAQK